MYRDTLEKVVGIQWIHVHHVELDMVFGHLDDKVPSTAGTARQVRRAAAVGIQRLNLERKGTSSAVSTKRGMRPNGSGTEARGIQFKRDLGS